MAPNETNGGGGLWTNSTVPEYAGWMWKADASSDEVCGHLLAFTVRAFVCRCHVRACAKRTGLVHPLAHHSGLIAVDGSIAERT